MNACELVVRFAENNAWSNHRLHRACALLDAEAFAATRTSFFPSLCATLNHILIVDWYYLDALERGGKGLSVFKKDVPFPDLTSLARAQRDADRRLIAFTRTLTTDAALDAEVQMQRRNHVQTDSVGNVLMHLFTHQTHHRGQAHAMLSGTDVKPPQLDEFFMRGDLSLRADELRELGLPVQ